MTRPTLAAVAVFASLAAPAAAQTPPVAPAVPLFTLDADATSGGMAVAFTRPASGVVRIDAIYNGAMNTTARVEVLAFSSDTGPAKVGLLPDCQHPDAATVNELSVPVAAGGSIPICLKADAMAPGAKVAGRLALSSTGSARIYRSVALTMPKTPDAVLVLDRSSLTGTVSRSVWPWWPVGHETVIDGTVVLREKTNALAVQGVTVRFEQVTASPESGFDLRRNIDFELNGRPVDLSTLLSPTAAAATRDIPAGGQASVRMRFHDLDPGDYTGVLRYGATNSPLDDAQKLIVSIHVRDSMVWAVLWMIMALCLSLLSTKVLVSQRRRASVLQQIHALPPMWLSSLQPTAAVVWVHATLHQVRSLTRKRWKLTIPDSVEASVADVRKVLSVLDAVRHVRDKLKLALDPLIFRRATFLLNDIAQSIGPASLDDVQVANINAELKVFDDWLSEERFPAACWKVIKPSIENELHLLASARMPDDAKPMVDAGVAFLQEKLKTPPATRREIADTYEQYVRLMLLREHRDDVKDFLEPAARMDIFEMLDVTDRLDWEKLKKAELTIRMPDDDSLETYQVLRFAVETNDPRVNGSYLFKNNVNFNWILKVEDPESASKDKWITRLTPQSIGPAILQYFPKTGKLTAAVTLTYKGDKVDRQGFTAGRALEESSDLQGLTLQTTIDHTSWIIAGLVAIATGLSTYYFKGTAWGTYQDYLSLFLWGVGVDQGKNFVQALGFTSGNPSAPASAANGH